MAELVVPDFRPAVPHFLPAEPAPFAKKRAAARAALDSVGVPSDKKYTNWLRAKVPEWFIDKAVGGLSPEFEIDQADYDTGFKTMAIPLSKAIKDWPEQTVPNLMGPALAPDVHYFSALSGALYRDGAVVLVPPNTKASVIARFSAEAGKLNAYRTIVIVSEGAELDYMEELADLKGSGDGTVIAHGVEVYVKPGAKLRFYGRQEWPDSVRQFAIYRAQVEENASLDWLIGSFGGAFSQTVVESELIGQGAESNVHSAYYGNGSQHIEQSLIANHAVGNTTSDTYARGIVAEQAKAVYRGMIKIKRGAHGSTADQNGHAMLMANTAHVDAIPALEIDADDVVAGHGATVGQVDDDQLFYLMARGIPREEATKMIIRGFFEHLFKKIPNDAVRNGFWRAVESKQG